MQAPTTTPTPDMSKIRSVKEALLDLEAKWVSASHGPRIVPNDLAGPPKLQSELFRSLARCRSLILFLGGILRVASMEPQYGRGGPAFESWAKEVDKIDKTVEEIKKCLKMIKGSDANLVHAIAYILQFNDQMKEILPLHLEVEQPDRVMKQGHNVFQAFCNSVPEATLDDSQQARRFRDIREAVGEWSKFRVSESMEAFGQPLAWFLNNGKDEAQPNNVGQASTLETTTLVGQKGSFNRSGLVPHSEPPLRN